MWPLPSPRRYEGARGGRRCRWRRPDRPAVARYQGRRLRGGAGRTARAGGLRTAQPVQRGGQRPRARPGGIAGDGRGPIQGSECAARRGQGQLRPCADRQPGAAGGDRRHRVGQRCGCRGHRARARRAVRDHTTMAGLAGNRWGPRSSATSTARHRRGHLSPASGGAVLHRLTWRAYLGASTPDVAQHVEHDARAEAIQLHRQLAHVGQALPYGVLLLYGTDDEQEAAPAGSGHLDT